MSLGKNRKIVRFVARAGIFSALAAILYIATDFLPIPMFSDFLKLHIDEVPVFIAAFAYGPFMGIVVLIVKTLIKLPLTQTACIGELADFLYSLVFVIPACLIYQKRRKFSFVLIGFGVSLIIQLAVSLLFNVYVMIPFYGKLFELPQEFIDSKWIFGLTAVLPFNAIKDVIVIALTLLTYKTLHKLIDKI